jgi:DNA-binding response OmpR family regulator
MRVLIAEDSPDVAEVVAFGTRMNWPECEVTVVGSGEAAVRAFEDHPADLVILDVTMPPPDGFEVCRHIRTLSDVPILMLTVRSATLDKVRALDLGADDYLTKPFDHLELLARLRALARRAARPAVEADAGYEAPGFRLDFAKRELRVDGRRVHLTTTEYEVLERLVRSAGSVLTHEQILESVWGAEYTTETHYTKVYIRRLRQKLGDDADNPRFLDTIWGVGYRFLPPHAPAGTPAGSEPAEAPGRAR